MKGLKSTWLVWLRSFFFIITIVMAFLLVFFFFVKSSIEKDAMKQNYSESNFLRKVVDEKLTAIPILAADITYKPEARKPLKEYDKSVFHSTEIYTLVNQLKSYWTFNNVIKDVFIYYPNQNHIVGRLGSHNTRSYYYLLNTSFEGYDKWVKEALDTDEANYYFYDDGTQKELMYSRSMNLSLSEKDYYKVILIISESALQETLKQSNSGNPQQVAAILTEDNKTYTFSGEPSLIQLSKEIPIGKESLNIRIDDCFVTFQESDINKLRYFMVKNKSDVLKISTQITHVLIMCVISSLGASLLVAFYLSIKNSEPVQQLLLKVQGFPEEKVNNPYVYINNKIDALLSYNVMALEQMDKQQKLMNASFVSTIIKVDNQDEMTLNALSAMYGINLENMFFCVIVLVFSDDKFKQKYVSMEDKFYDEIESCFGDSNMFFGGMVSEEYVYLLNYDLMNKSEGKLPETFISKLLDLVNENDIACKIAVGGVYNNAKSINASYSEALYMLDHFPNPISYYKPSLHKCNEEDGGRLYDDFERCLASKEYEKALDLLERLFACYIPGVQPFVMKYRRYAIINQVYDAVLRETKDKEQGFVMKQECEELLFSNQSQWKVMQRIAFVLERLNHMTVQNPEYDGSIASLAKQIMDSTFANPMLGLASISDQLGVSGSYISRIFKKRYNIGIAEYISRVRIEHAKEKIISGNMNIKAIALSVGFSSDVSFIRVFKKYENITPGKYNSDIN